MRYLTWFQTASAMAVLALVTGCSGGGSSALAPRPIPFQAGEHTQNGLVPNALDPFGIFNVATRNSRRNKSYYSCPATGPIIYVSDDVNNAVYVYKGKFAGQAPCGQIASGVFSAPTGLYVDSRTHDLYVANTTGYNFLVFHRGQTTPYNTYTDPNQQYTLGITLAKDGTVIGSNQAQVNQGDFGSLSTWKAGPNGGTFVGHFPMFNSFLGLFLTVQKNGTVYYGDLDQTTGSGVLWSVSCPAGACGTETQLSGILMRRPAGMGSDDTEDLLVIDSTLGTINTFELPNPTPSSFSVAGGPVGMALNRLDHHLFVAHQTSDNAAEYSYPSGTLIGTVPPGISGGMLIGIALDPSHAR